MTARFTLDDLTTPLTVDEAKASLYSVLEQVGVNTTNWKPGAVVRTMFAAVAIAVAAGSQLTSRIARMGVAELSEGDWLTLVAHYGRGVDRIDATFASGTLLLTNIGGGIYSFEPAELVFRNATTKKLYVNTQRVDVPSGGAVPARVSVAVRAVDAGSASSAAAGDVTEFETPFLGLTVSNSNALVGQDAESDAELRRRYSERLGVLSACGPSDAYAFVAKSATRLDGSPVGVTKVRVVKDSGFGIVSVYVATATGGVPGDAEDPDSDLGRVAAAIRTQAAPHPVTVIVRSATPVVIPVACSISMYATTLTRDEIAARVEAALVELMRNKPIGGDVEVTGGALFKSDIEAAISGAVPGIFHVLVTSPGSDLFLGPSDVAQLGAVTIAQLTIR